MKSKSIFIIYFIIIIIVSVIIFRYLPIRVNGGKRVERVNAAAKDKLEKDEGPYRGIFTEKGEKAPGFTLTDQDGNRVSLSDLRGRVVLMSFIYTRCKEACPLLQDRMLDIQKKFKDKLGRDLILVSVTMDPENDTPEVLKKHALKLGADLRSWHFLTGSKGEVEKVLKNYGFLYKRVENEYGHEVKYIIIGRDGTYLYDVAGKLVDSGPLIWKLMALLGGPV